MVRLPPRLATRKPFYRKPREPMALTAKPGGPYISN